MTMFGRRAFLKALFFLGLVIAYPIRKVWGQVVQAETVAIPLDKLQSPWDSVPFTFGSGNIPGLAVRLPDSRLTVVSRLCPHQKCFTDLIKDPAQVFRETTFEPEGPVLACPCHGSVFDLQEGGKVLFGPAPRAPDQFQFQIAGDKIIISGLSSEPH
ncbi:Rieske (2Fe-2S) protein [bacterium]|nr:MAG: Rieske (2Fe-2S) protein [bacterium]